ncbi:hypothetical protein HETIRDRAFT_332521 [Heterobasidion irregulare TC 32-1]|uniref:F-box domain-containing protein n=1 Tax=Heterobasidion irregulare (strain TC 32-1) TaxID=747525 RepID=W4JNQ8_HETIT|nr:uncharacterized protein HETIRDRAFT_332521 [Heterobasidion irregulare TC 32-1]ETW74700.1 hypothetical protein HETIRDRAFT_332521 [Heterobasidion irregulare TC 32-1]
MASIAAGLMSHLYLPRLPYDLLLVIVQHLGFSDIQALQMTCKSLRQLLVTRPVYRHLAMVLLRRCRALPLAGFQRLSEITTEQLIHSVYKAAQLERAWLTRTPRPATSSPTVLTKSWYKVVSTPPHEEVDWLSPITASYTLCATRSGKVICWDVLQDVSLAEWSPGERWELWKCRVEFDKRTVFFTMARGLGGTHDAKLMEFDLMQIYFPESEEDVYENGHLSTPSTPVFSHLRSFKMSGLVMNIFLLDPPARLLAGFVWIVYTNTIGLYVLPDWDSDEYIFIDTAIACVASSNWSCILHDEEIVIHAEEPNGACQHFYPLSLLRQCVALSSSSPSFVPIISGVFKPARVTPQFVQQLMPGVVAAATAVATGHANPLGPNPPNPLLYPVWYPESAHFVRQWWPTMAMVPGLSCTVVLLAKHDTETHQTKHVLSQHYFRVPLLPQSEGAAEDALMRMWYVSAPFEVVCVIDVVIDELDENGAPIHHSRPLLAVDFGHAVWIEYVEDNTEVPEGQDPPPPRKNLRFVSFPSVYFNDRGEVVYTSIDGSSVGSDDGDTETWPMEGEVRTLEIPEELNLDSVETLNIDQSQGAVIMSVKEGKIFILCYE